MQFDSVHDAVCLSAFLSVCASGVGVEGVWSAAGCVVERRLNLLITHSSCAQRKAVLLVDASQDDT